jgi:hypothetical protein
MNTKNDLNQKRSAESPYDVTNRTMNVYVNGKLDKGVLVR